MAKTCGTSPLLQNVDNNEEGAEEAEDDEMNEKDADENDEENDEDENEEDADKEDEDEDGDEVEEEGGDAFPPPGDESSSSSSGGGSSSSSRLQIDASSAVDGGGNRGRGDSVDNEVMGGSTQDRCSVDTCGSEQEMSRLCVVPPAGWAMQMRIDPTSKAGKEARRAVTAAANTVGPEQLAAASYTALHIAFKAGAIDAEAHMRKLEELAIE
jgi:hypothetical protein